jgi:two-component system, sporulation sensor kinase E
MPVQSFREMVLPKVLDRLDRLDRDAVTNYLSNLLQELNLARRALSGIRDAVVFCDAHGHIISVNPAAHQLLGIPEPLPAGEPVSKHIRGPDWVRILQAGASQHVEFEIDYPDRRRVEMQFIVLPPRSADNGSSGAGATAAGSVTVPESSEAHQLRNGVDATILLILREVSLNLDDLRELAAQERIQGVVSLAAGVAHEIGNPLNSLQIQLQLLKRQLPTPRGKKNLSMHERVDAALNEIRRLDAILRQFLKAVRPAPPQLRPCALNTVVDETMRSMQPELEARELILELDLAADLPPVFADPDQIRQVLYNLVRNAIQASPQRSILRVSTRRTARGSEFSVHDKGCGMTPEVMARVFEPYFTTKESGNGLGLYIVRRIVHAHGGEIKVRSAPCEGTEVAVELPALSPTLRLAPPAKTQDAPLGES